ncbi:MAG: tetratricopeptide repeat protein [Haliea sp.]|nr:tetratricopeptide repeat protein [Haliea sp.]
MHTPRLSRNGHRSVCRTRPRYALLALATLANLLGATASSANPNDIARAEQLVQASNYQEAYELLLPLAEQNTDNAAFNILLGESALRTNRAEDAVTFFQRSLHADPDSKNAHLGLARAYLALGDYPPPPRSSSRPYCALMTYPPTCISKWKFTRAQPRATPPANACRRLPM